ncbi:MAG: tail fiber domain-containing protein, partial [Bacteroidota bacterium]
TTNSQQLSAQISIKPDKACINCSTPHSSAVFEVKSIMGGMLVPKMSSTQRATIPAPANGLLVYDETTSSFWVFAGSFWRNLAQVVTENENTGLGELALNGVSGPQNVAVGRAALSAGTNGGGNVGVGYWSLFGNSSGNVNTATGHHSMYTNTMGWGNAATGASALYSNISGYANIANGYQALYSNEIGFDNIAIGRDALYDNVTGFSNVGIGVKALFKTNSQSNLVAIGDSTLLNNGTGATNAFQAVENTAIGSKALMANTRGSSNTAVGFEAAKASTIGTGNTAIGHQALQENTDGSDNVAIGRSAMQKNKNGGQNVAIGTIALHNNTSGTNNTAIGLAALYDNSEGNNNIAIGLDASFRSDTSDNNIAIGRAALRYNNTISGLIAIGDSTMFYSGSFASTGGGIHGNKLGKRNIAIGNQAFFENIEGYQNTVIGQEALRNSQFTHGCTAIGFQSLYHNQGNRNLNDGNENTAVGQHALYENISGYRNTALGNEALDNNRYGDRNTAIGYAANVNDFSIDNATAVGNTAVCTASNQVRLGNTSVTSIGGHANWSNISDARFKRKIKKDVPGLAFIQALQPVTYTLDVAAINQFLGVSGTNDATAIQRKSATRQTGFLAQEVEAAAKQLGFDFSGVDAPKSKSDPYGLRYAEFVVPLVKAVQELAKENEQLKAKVAQIDELENTLSDLQKLVDQLVQEPKANENSQVVRISAAQLFQNEPNPADGSTVIRYFIPENTKRATLQVMSEQGQIIKTIKIDSRGLGQTILQMEGLGAGVYHYTLLVDGEPLAAKKMVLVHK